MTEDEPRVDGRELQEPTEPGSDDRLDESVRAKIAEAVGERPESRTLRERLRERFER